MWSAISKRGAHMPVIVIVTAYDSYAIEAFEAGAVDYLLKPVGQERLAQAVERARRVTGRKPSRSSRSFRKSPEPASAAERSERSWARSAKNIFS